MKDCLKEQKEVEQQILLADILFSEKTINDFKNSLAPYEKGLEDTVAERQNHLKSMKIQEGELKKMSNNEEMVQNKIKSKKEELLTCKMDNMNSQKAIETAKGMIA